MSDLLEHRDAFFSLVADAHGNAQPTPAAESALPAGHRWIPYTPKFGPRPERRRRPVSSQFADFFAQ